ncbi:heterokaryon incompatibility protein [Neurospora crassa]|nr:heterokaryon incompatibility protein [Neurospora crassa]
MENSTQTDASLNDSLFSYDSVRLFDPSTEIRLLDLHPGSSYTDDLSGYIYTVSISQAPSYIALSYVWGDSTRTHEISVVNEVNDGRGAFVTLRLTTSLDICLRHFRTLQRQWQIEPLPLWIDQLCINQEDDKEKSFQVLLMKDIYSSAHQVIVWLGPAADGSDKVMDAFADIGQELLDKIGDHLSEGQWLSVDRLIEKKIEQPGVVAFLKKAYKVVYALKRDDYFARWQKRPWFTRVWTIQEFCLCSDTIFACGYKVVPEKLVSAVADLVNCIVMDRCLRERLEAPDTPTYCILTSCFLKLHLLFQRRMHCQYPNAKETLEHLLVELFAGSTRFYATNQRDKVYGILGLAGDADELGIRPDYSPSTTNAQVWTQTAKAIIEKKWKAQRVRGLYILRYGSLGQRRSAQPGEVMSSIKTEREVPSWVPEWDKEMNKTYVGTTSFSACGKFRTTDLVPTSSLTILGVRGFCVDTIVDLGEQAPADHVGYRDGPKKIVEFFDSVKRLLRMSKQNKWAKNIYASATHHDSALWRVPIGDQYVAYGVGQQHTKRTDSKVESVYRKFMAYYEDYASREGDWNDYITAHKAGNKQVNLAADMHMDELLAEGYYIALLYMQGKRPYVTKNGYLGMGPGHSKPGDKVVVFHGDTIPYVVRPVPEKGDKVYLLMGEAYCDGIMDGELADTAEREDFYLV